jgi:protein ImuA
MAGTSLSFSALLGRPDIWRGDSLNRAGGSCSVVPSGFPELDAGLPGGGWPTGALTEILPAHEGIGELRLLGPALASRRGLRLAWIAPPHLPYAPALAAAGIDIARLVIVRTLSRRDTLWAVEQALASNACGAVLAWIQGAKYAELRRLQLAAEGGRAPAFLFRPPEAAGEFSPAALRIALGTANGGLAVSVFKRRGVSLARPILLPTMPPAVRGRNLRVDRRPADTAAARNFPARPVHA